MTDLIYEENGYTVEELQEAVMTGNWDNIGSEALDYEYEERASIMIYDGGTPTFVAEQEAAVLLGFNNKADLKRHVQLLKAKGL